MCSGGDLCQTALASIQDSQFNVTEWFCAGRSWRRIGPALAVAGVAAAEVNKLVACNQRHTAEVTELRSELAELKAIMRQLAQERH